MKKSKIALSIATILFSALGLFRIVPFRIATPLMLFSLATLLLLRSIEYKKKGDKSGFVITIFTALFVYIVILAEAVRRMQSASSIAIIGDADGPTAVFIAEKVNHIFASVVVIIGIVIVAGVVYWWKRKK